MPNTDELLQDISERMQTIETTATEARDAASEETLRSFVEQYFDNLDDDDPIVRKMRFARDDDDIKGSKFARRGLGAADIEFLHDYMTATQDAGRSKGPSEELQRAFQAVSPATRAMDTQESGFGAELQGAQYVGDLWEAARNESRVANLITSFEMTDATAYLPVEVDIPEMLLVSESTTSSATDYSTVKTGSNRVQVTANKFALHQMYSAEVEEDSIIPFVPFLRRQATMGLSHYLDSVIVNGDTTNAATGNINNDDADPADTKHYLAADGLRHVGLVDNTSNGTAVGAGLTFSNLLSAKGLMQDTTNLHDWGHPSASDDLVYLADPATADQIVGLDETLNTRYRNGGSDLLVFNGELARIYGHPIVSTNVIKPSGADGQIETTTASNNDGGTVVAFNRRGFIQGWRRRVKLATEYLPATDQFRLVYTLRWGFGRFTPTGSAANIESAAVLYDITL